ncbi:MAG: nucleoside triphosphate pyrophosphohydrolase [Solibacillus sp.]
MIHLNKLVRDKVPSLVTKDGGSYSLKLLSPLEHQTELTKKLFEEIKEYSMVSEKVGAVDELIDIVELAYAAAKLHGYTPEQFEELRHAKRKHKGGFEKGIYLHTISK